MEKVEDMKVDEVQPAMSNLPVADSSGMRQWEVIEWGDDFAVSEVQPVHSNIPFQDAAATTTIDTKADEDSKIKALIKTPPLGWQPQPQEGSGGMARGFGGFRQPEVQPVHSNIPFQDAASTTTIDTKADEDSKIKALIKTPHLGWQPQPQEGSGGMARGFGWGMGGFVGRGGFERTGFKRKTSPQDTCHRCKVPGHFIQHCPTNGDVNYDIKRVKPPTGIPKSMLMATPGGSHALPSGAVAVLRPIEGAFEKEIEGLPSTRSVCDLPPELRCPLCKDVMKDAVLTSKCCFQSFCDKCIRDHIISKSMCICGATNVLVDDLLPNKTVRDIINRILESNNSSTKNGGSMLPQVQDTESAEWWKQAPPHSTTYNPYFGMQGMQLGMNGYMAPYNGAMPYMVGYAPNPFDRSFAGMVPQVPFGGQGYNMMQGGPPQRNLSELRMRYYCSNLSKYGMRYNPVVAPPVMSREEFVAQRAERRRKREMKQHVEKLRMGVDVCNLGGGSG